MSEEKKRKVGRPPKAQDEKAIKVWVYLTPQEKRKLDRYIKTHLTSVSKVLRDLLHSSPIFKDDDDDKGPMKDV